MTNYSASLRAAAELELRRRRNRTSWHDTVHPLMPHPKQELFLNSAAKRKVIRAGRRGGKTTGITILAVRAFMAGRRILYATPTQEQVDAFWYEVKKALQEPIDAGILYKNESSHIIEVPGTKNRIRAKTAWDADSLRGDYADLLILDEYQLINEDAWGRVGAPMMLDNDGDAVFIYTPPSLHSKFRTKARDPQHAAKLFNRAKSDASGRWEAFHFTSYDNPFLSITALEDITLDMTSSAIQQEIMAEDTDETPGALWSRTLIDGTRKEAPETLRRVAIGVDPPGGVTEAGIVVAGYGDDGHWYILEDGSLQGSPDAWSSAVIECYERWQADVIVGESNFGGDMVEHTIRTADGGRRVNFRKVTASRGKAVRAEPIAALYERGKVHHTQVFPHLENELCNWLPDGGGSSPNRLDALVWTMTELALGDNTPTKRHAHNPFYPG